MESHSASSVVVFVLGIVSLVAQSTPINNCNSNNIVGDIKAALTLTNQAMVSNAIITYKSSYYFCFMITDIEIEFFFWR